MASTPSTRASICHCSMCRKAAGTPYVAFLTLPCAQLCFTAAAPATYHARARAQRGFCAQCGSALVFDDRASIIDVSSTALDAPEHAPPVDQIYAVDAVSWADKVPGLPSYPGPRGG